jgi:DNA-binding IclR family transcriptional regulator
MTAENTDERDQSGIQSVEIAGQVLRAIIAAGEPVPLREIAARSNIHPSKVHRYLVSLTRTGLVEQDSQRGHYGAGPLTIPLAFTRLRNLDFIAMAEPVLAELRDASKETALLTIWSESGPVVLRLYESARPVSLNVRIGSLLSLDSSAAGLALSAFVPEPQLKAVLEAQIAQGRMKRSATKPFLAKLEDVRRDGVASVRGTLVPGVSAIASPIFDAGGRAVLAIGILGHEADVDTSLDSHLSQLVLDGARTASERMGYIRRDEPMAARNERPHSQAGSSRSNT